MASSQHVRVDLAPKAGFCVKSSALTPGVLPPPPAPKPPNPNLLEPFVPITVPKGLKVFVNIAWDPNVPPPPEGSEEEIMRAMQGEEVDENNPSGWYVPVIVSNAREEKDKAGNPSIVFDCIYNTSVKSRTLRDPEFKIFLVELALQRIEVQTGLNLSRHISTPNIASKGKLLPRTVQIPASLLPVRSGAATSASAPASTPGTIVGAGADLISSRGGSSSKPPLIQEIPAPSPSNTRHSAPNSQTNAPATTPKPTTGGSPPGLRGILKNPNPPPTSPSTSSTTPSQTSSIPLATQNTTSTSTHASKTPNARPDPNPGPPGAKSKPETEDAAVPLDWSWTKDDSGRLRIDVLVPGLTHALVRSSTLDVEPRRFTLSITSDPTASSSAPAPGSQHTLDIDLAPSDAYILSRVPAPSKTSRVLELKRERDFDVDGARAEWVVGSGVVVLWV